MIGLRKANHIRRVRANLKQELREGRVRLEQVLATRTDYLASAEVFDLLMAVPKIGPVKAGRLLAVARISPSKTVSELSERQRTRLIELLSGSSTNGRSPFRLGVAVSASPGEVSVLTGAASSDEIASKSGIGHNSMGT